MDHCLFHSARPQFDKMVRSVQQAKIIPKQFAGRLAMAVCSCRKKIFNHNENTKHMKNNNNQTEAMVAGGDEKIIKEFCEALKKLAINQQKKMDTRYKAIKERRSRRRKHVFNVTMTTDDDDDDVNNDTNLKDELADNYAFTRKKLWQKKSQASGQKTANQSVLMGGHCLSCLKPFNGLKTESGEKDPCIYHPGYTYFNIEDSTIRWTCCDEQALDDKPTPEDHSQTGCCSGNHIWRPHKKVSRKPGVNHKEENVGDIAKKLVNQNSVGMSSKNVLSVYNSWFT
ncbi:hypothetical protein KUTeg_020964 [Tegillarca granosa]|uniref:Uncharacterized protein n=1 Tax=Tegillarca granosa TaxID=220873 RepID=A0ABQ9EEK4_TEGGR|nr:hypothetical protein KUTeg_020964 [Tegillarca granosa]